ncbi:helix-turn-helix domain-containing protein [Microbacterium sp. NPDC077184]|uniref:AraC-like ligand-binding domain-containing protein n=1 Tax=Microbacterium sp. NPDC077184 TaxID=3154764 RepID=UPI00342EECF4
MTIPAFTPDAVHHRGATAHGILTARAHDLSEFRTAVNDSFVPLSVTSDHPDRFRGAIRAGHADGVHLSDVRARSHVVERTPELIARRSQPSFKVSVMLAGSGLLVQDGREALLHPGDLAVYDTSRPYTLVFDGDFRTVVMMFSHDALGLPAREVHQLTAVRIAGETGLGALAAPYIARLGTHLDEVAAVSGPRLVHTALDLLTTVYSRETGLDAAAADPHRALLHRIAEHIEANLGSTALSPGSIAAAHYISTRHLHNLFHAEGTTVSTVIRERRLAHCRRELADPLLADRSVAAIGARWGFPDAAHFSRAFKAAFGMSPSDFRSR